MLGAFLSPHYAEEHFVYLTYAEPGGGGSSLALAQAKARRAISTTIRIAGPQVAGARATRTTGSESTMTPECPPWCSRVR
jgi:hypothetical protein